VPGFYAALLAKLHLPETGIGEIAEIIAADVAMTAKILQLVNSAFFGFR
jgi:HD-like signal output (HDOD) protein